ncbi:MAG: SLC13 family permease [Burkholderiales bacterium]
MPPLDLHAIAVLALTVFAFAMFALERLPIETTSLLVLVLLSAGFQLVPYVHDGVRLSPVDFFFGFGHEALVAICSLMILGRGLVATGALEPAARLLARMLSARPGAAMLLVLVACAAFSGVLNDTPIVVLMMPILVGAALRAKSSASRTLLPMNFAVLIGGMGTTIGTSTNLLVVAIAADLGVRHFEMFEFMHVTALAAVGGILYLWLVLPRLLPQRDAPLGDAAPQVFSAVLYVSEGSFADEKPLSEVQEKVGRAMRIARVVRADGLELARMPTLKLRAGDRLYVSASGKELREAADALSTKLYKVDDLEHPVDEEHPLAAEGQHLAEVVVTETSPLNRSTLRATNFGSYHDVAIVGLHRTGGQALRSHDDIGGVVLRTGDVLLVQGTEEAIGKLRTRAQLLVLGRARSCRAPNGRRWRSPSSQSWCWWRLSMSPQSRSRRSPGWRR